MNSQKLLLEKLWDLLKQKIIQDWPVKYQSRFGTLEESKKFALNKELLIAIRLDIINTCRGKLDDLKIHDIEKRISLDTLSRAFSTDRLANKPHINTRHILSFYIGHTSWRHFTGDFYDFETKNYPTSNIPNEEGKQIRVLDEPQCFICHYMKSAFDPGRDVILIYPDRAELIMFNISETQNKKVPSMIYEGEFFVLKGDETTIYFNKEIKDGDKFRTETPIFCCYENTSNDLKLGVFTSTFKRVSCGAMILERTPFKEYVNKINEPGIPSYIFLMLCNKRIFPAPHEKKREYLRSEKDIASVIEKYAGVYEAYAIVPEKRLAIQKFAFNISANGDVSFVSYSKRTGEYGRIVTIRENRNMVMQFSPSLGHTYYKIQVVLDLRNNSLNLEMGGENNALIGIYGGIEETSNSPMAGRIILFKTKKTFEEIKEPKLFELDNDYKIQSLFDEKKPRGRALRKFFRGELDDYADSPLIIEQCKFLSSK